MTAEALPDRSVWAALWELYHDAFEPLQELALLNHLYQRADFEGLVADERITKLIAWSGERPVGLAMFTSELELVPQISPPFLHARYPDESARDAVFFCIMVFVCDDFRRSTVFPRLIAGMGEITSEAQGVAVFDVCRHNLDEIEIHRQIEAMTRWFPGAEFAEVDSQTYFAITVPERPRRRLPISTLASKATPTPPRRSSDVDARVASG